MTTERTFTEQELRGLLDKIHREFQAPGHMSLAEKLAYRAGLLYVEDNLLGEMTKDVANG